MLGYHRESTFQKDRSGFAENKRRLFWMLCSYDRADSLLFGHASKVQDFDIDTRLPTPSSSPFQRPWDDLFRLGISMTGIQGQIYNKLYSVAALQSPPGERKRWIDKLTAELCEWKNDFDQVSLPRPVVAITDVGISSSGIILELNLLARQSYREYTGPSIITPQ